MFSWLASKGLVYYKSSHLSLMCVKSLIWRKNDNHYDYSALAFWDFAKGFKLFSI